MEKPTRPVVDISAQCACGAVGVRLNGKVLSMFLCSCEDCQRATGTGHSAVVLVRPESVSITGAARSFVRPANSGATMIRSFCPECGTPIAAHSSRAPTLMMLPAGLFGRDARWFVPSQLIFARSHHDWDTIPAELPQHTTYRDEGTMM